jgi:SAM-dependent methyltransferase/acyl carrier protein
VAGEGKRANAISGAAPETTDDWLYETVWKRASRLVGRDAPRLSGVPALVEVGERVEQRLPAVAAEHRLETYDALLPELDALCGLYVRKGFADLGVWLKKGDRISAEALRVRFGILDAHRRLLDRLLVILEEEGVLRKDGVDWELVHPLTGEDPDERFRRLLEGFPAHQAELTVTARCGGRLAEVLQGRADPLQVLFPGGSVDLAEKLYQEAPAARVFNTLVREVMRIAVGAVEGARTIRVIEIGAGTGATTAHVLSVLPGERTEYVFTDVSRLFLGKAEEKFRDRPSLRYTLLDIERDPVDQGFAPHTFDVVIAGNVLHATADLRRTLAHVRRLLAPEGLLVLLEATGPHRFEDLTVGLTEGWWRFRDVELRPSYALLSQERWVELLREEGFTDPVAVPARSGLQGALAHQAVVIARGPRAAAGGRWFVLADRGGLGAKLADNLCQRGGDCVVVPASKAVTSDDLRGALESDGKSWRGVIHLRGLDGPTASDLSVRDLNDAERDLCGSALALTQAVVQLSARPRLWIVTRGAQPAGLQRHPLSVPQAPLWGLGKVVALEHPELRCIRVDLDPAGEADASELLVAELLSGGVEDQVAFRGSERLVARLARAAPPPLVRPTFSTDATYLITGGLAGLGLVVARWLVERGARHLVLMGRRAPAAAATATMRELEAQGATVVVAQGDVAQEARVQEILAGIAAAGPPLRGIIHAAGVLDDGVLLQQTWERFATVLAPKVAGAWNLHRLTQGLPLDFFVLFSSAAALLGSPGQANHAAANAFLDALAHHRRALGLPALSINWGVWSGSGVAAERGIGARAAVQGMGSFSPEEGLRVLGRVMAADPVQIGVVSAQWSKLLKALRLRSAFVAEIVGRAGGGVAQEAMKASEPVRTGIRSELERAAPAERQRRLVAFVRERTVKVLALDPTEEVDVQKPLNELGLDSLMAVELRNALGSGLGLAKTLPATLVFDHPTIADLSDYLGRSALGLDVGKPIPDSKIGETAGGGLLDRIEQLSEEEVERIFGNGASESGQ